MSLFQKAPGDQPGVLIAAWPTGADTSDYNRTETFFTVAGL